MNPKQSFGNLSNLADYSAILRQDSPWRQGVIKLSDGSHWVCAEPGAQITVRRGDLRIQVTPFTKHHDANQTFDNSKHLYFSKDVYPTADEQETQFELSMSARGVRTNEGDIYDGFIAFHLLDAEFGIAADFFAGNDSLAMAYSLPQESPADRRALRDRRYMAIFKKFEIPTSPGQLHRYKIVYNRGLGRFSWIVDGKKVAEERNVPAKVSSFRIGLGIMTAKNITDGKSISVHGQGMIGRWSPVQYSSVPEC